MTLTESGESRVNGYLFVLERSLSSFLPRDTVRDAVKEIESHLRERISAADGAPNERVVLERILAELGPPLRVAQAYSAERVLDEAVTTGRFVAVARAVWHLAVSTVNGFLAGLLVLVGYTLGIGFVVLAAMKPIFPDNVGIQMSNGIPIGIGARFPAPAEPLVGGYWIVPVFLAIGLCILVATHRCARRFVVWWRNRHQVVM
jgi:uncharacterized membrane protein